MSALVEWFLVGFGLSVDLPPRSSIAVPMDDIDRELISLLSTKIGMLMEDHSALALAISSPPSENQADSLVDLDKAAQKITALVAAARSISE